jgi:adenylate cyclase
MAQTDVERRLIAILVADMAGYSRLMELDGPGTLARLKTHRLELIDPALAKNKGRSLVLCCTGGGRGTRVRTPHRLWLVCAHDRRSH